MLDDFFNMVDSFIKNTNAKNQPNQERFIINEDYTIDTQNRSITKNGIVYAIPDFINFKSFCAGEPKTVDYVSTYLKIDL